MPIGQGLANPNFFLNTDKEAEALAQAYAGYGDIVDQQSGLANEFRQRLTELEREKPKSKLQKVAGVASYILPALGAIIDKTSGDPQKRGEAMPQFQETMDRLQQYRRQAEVAKSQKKEDELRSLKAQYEIGMEPIRAAAAKQDKELQKRREILDIATRKVETVKEDARYDAARGKAIRDEKDKQDQLAAMERLLDGRATTKDRALLALNKNLPDEVQALSPEESQTEFDAKADEFAMNYVEMLDASKTMDSQQKEAAFTRARQMFVNRYAKKGETSDNPADFYPALEGDMSPEQAQELLGMLSQGMMAPQAQPASTLMMPNVVRPSQRPSPVAFGGFKPLGVR